MNLNINGIVQKFNEMTAIIRVHQQGLKDGLDKDNPDFFSDYLADLKRCSDKIVQYFAEGKTKTNSIVNESVTCR